MGRYGSLDYPRLTKRSFVFGLVLFAVGLAGQATLGASLIASHPWELSLLFDVEAVGLVVAFFSPFVFGILLPLTE